MARGRNARGAGPYPSTTLVLDNGGSTIKAGFVRDPPAASDLAPRVIPNCIARDRHKKVYVGSELTGCRDYGELQVRRPVEKGFVVNWEAQREIWDREFLDDEAPQRCDPAETRLVLAEQPNSLPALQTHCDQMVFEKFGFASYYRGTGPSFNAYNDIQAVLQTAPEFREPRDVPAEVVLVIDSGYSCTTVTPVLQGRPLHPAVRRLDIGGKLLTNHLARLLSVRHFDMRNETHIANEMKESACYVSLDFAGDLEKCWKGTRGHGRPDYVKGAGIARDYILPDFHTRFRGLVTDHDPARGKPGRSKGDVAADDVLTLRNERFAVPEVLFRPTDVGSAQPGLADVIMQSLHALPVGLWPGLLANIFVVGGNALLDNFVRRLQAEMLQRVPAQCVVRIARPDNPIVATWEGAAAFARTEHVQRLAVTKGEYEEYGPAWVARKFAAGLGVRG